jgi:chromosome segregation ATPase
MYRQAPKGRILPKISTMPRQQSEAAVVLDIYKLAIDKERLQQELQGIEQRRQQILQRLEVLETQVDQLEGQAHHLREPIALRSPAQQIFRPVRSAQFTRAAQPAEQFDTLFLEY